MKLRRSGDGDGPNEVNSYSNSIGTLNRQHECRKAEKTVVWLFKSEMASTQTTAVTERQKYKQAMIIKKYVTSVLVSIIRGYGRDFWRDNVY